MLPPTTRHRIVQNIPEICKARFFLIPLHRQTIFKNKSKMKKMMFMALAAVVLCGSFASCSKDDDDVIPAEDDKEVKYYDYSEKGFFMNGEIKVRGYFDNDSIMEGYTKYVKRTASYVTVDGDENEIVLGYGLVVGINNFARFYSDDVTYNADSTAITCKGQIELNAYDGKAYDASITAGIDSVGKPHLVTCSAAVDGKRLTLQFRQTYQRSEYSDAEVPKKDAFSI